MAGKYKCLLCEKEFISESGVKYHINSVHAEVRQAEWKPSNPRLLEVGRVLEVRRVSWEGNAGFLPWFIFSLLAVGNRVLDSSAL